MSTKILLTGHRGGLGHAIWDRISRELRDFDMLWGLEIEDKALQNLREITSIIVAQGANNPVEPGQSGAGQAEWDANWSSIIELAQQWVHEKRGQPGRKPFIVLVSNSAIIPRTNSLHYCASKAAMDMALKVLHRQYAREGFEFYSLCSSTVAQTPMTERIFNEEYLGAAGMQKAMERFPLQRLITKEEVAEWVWFILSTPAAVLAAGQSLRLDSGEH